MTRKQAEAKIAEIHPEDGYIFDRKMDVKNPDSAWRHGRFYVGHSKASETQLYGNGNSWDKAFDDLATKIAQTSQQLRRT